MEEKVDVHIVVFGTGSYIFDGDDNSLDIQSMYGVWDRLGNTTVLKTELVEQEFTAISGDAARVEFFRIMKLTILPSQGGILIL